jgi:hypothetical protein
VDDKTALPWKKRKRYEPVKQLNNKYE